VDIIPLEILQYLPYNFALYDELFFTDIHNLSTVEAQFKRELFATDKCRWIAPIHQYSQSIRLRGDERF